MVSSVISWIVRRVCQFLVVIWGTLYSPFIYMIYKLYIYIIYMKNWAQQLSLIHRLSSTLLPWQILEFISIAFLKMYASYTPTKKSQARKGLLETEVSVVCADLRSGSSWFCLPSDMIIGMVFTLSLSRWVIVLKGISQWDAYPGEDPSEICLLYWRLLSANRLFITSFHRPNMGTSYKQLYTRYREELNLLFKKNVL